MKEDIDLLIEYNERKRDEYANFIFYVEKLPSPKEKTITLHQGKNYQRAQHLL